MSATRDESNAPGARARRATDNARTSLSPLDFELPRRRLVEY